MKQLWCRAAFALMLILIALATLPARAAPGDLDRSFGGYGTGGRVLSEPFPGTSITGSVATPDERLIVLGSDGRDIVVVRYDARGMLDPTFGTDGVTILDFNNQIDTASAIAISYNATSILIAGTTMSGPPGAPNADFAVALLNGDGMPNTSFSQDGKTTVDFNGRADRATAVAAFVQDRILVAGSVEATAGGQDVGLAILNSDGSLYASFGTGGKAQYDFGGDETPLTVLLSSNTIYVGGYRVIGTTSEYLISLHQYGSGKLLPSFNGTGYRTGAVPARATDLLAVGSFGDEDIVISGNVGGDFGLLRFKEDGSPVTTWGNAGRMTVDFGGDDTPHTLSYLPEGTIAVAGASGTRLALARISDTGQLVPNSAVTTDVADAGGDAQALAIALVPDVRLWTISAVTAGNTARLALTRHFLAGGADAGGQQATDLSDMRPFGGRANDDRAKVAVFQPDGKLLVAGSTSPDGNNRHAALVRYTRAGALDPALDGDGQLFLTDMANGATGMALQAGKIVVAGERFNVVRLRENGSLDTSFNGTGKAAFAIPNGFSQAMLIQPDGKIVLAGYANSPGPLVVARFTAEGAPDSSFGLDGIQRVGIGLSASAFGLAIQPDGKLIVAGWTAPSQTDLDFALVRLNGDGTLDRSFDGDGKVTTDFGNVDAAFAVAIQPDGAILAAGTSVNNGAAFARYRPEDGSLDTSFNGDGMLLLQLTGNDWARALTISETGITAALCDQNEDAGVVVRLTTSGQLDSSINGNGRLPFRFGGTDCPFGLAQTADRVAAVGYARSLRSVGFHQLSEDFAVALYDDAVAPPPVPPTAPVPALTPTVPVPPPTAPVPASPTPGPGSGYTVALPLVIR